MAALQAKPRLSCACLSLYQSPESCPLWDVVFCISRKAYFTCTSFLENLRYLQKEYKGTLLVHFMSAEFGGELNVLAILLIFCTSASLSPQPMWYCCISEVTTGSSCLQQFATCALCGSTWSLLHWLLQKVCLAAQRMLLFCMNSPSFRVSSQLCEFHL